MRFAITTSFALAATLAGASARAQAAPQPVPPGYEQRDAPPPQYVAPLSQATQPSYVPQSVALSGPQVLRNWQEGDPIPPGYRPVERTRTGLLAGGIATLGSLYFFSALVAAGNGDAHHNGPNPAAALWVPVIGPFVQMGSSDSQVAGVFLAVDGLGQAAGAAMLIYGAFVPKTVVVRNDLATNEPKPEIHAVPLVGGGTTGAGLVGTF